MSQKGCVFQGLCWKDRRKLYSKGIKGPTLDCIATKPQKKEAVRKDSDKGVMG